MRFIERTVQRSVAAPVKGVRSTPRSGRTARKKILLRESSASAESADMPVPEVLISADALSRLRGYPFPDWEQLCGAEVDVYLDSEFVRRGVVDAATADGRIIWIGAQGVFSRTLIDKTQGYEVWITPTEELSRRNAAPASEAADSE
ncbi:UNVERIFIED_ORG: hypothetical protein ABIB52_003711 [Arthrobacter sp. UYCu721]